LRQVPLPVPRFFLLSDLITCRDQCDIRDFYGGEDSSHSLLGYDAVYWCGSI